MGKKKLGEKNTLSTNFWVFWVKKNFELKFFLVQTNILGQTNFFGSNKYFGSINFFDKKKNFFDQKKTFLV